MSRRMETEARRARRRSVAEESVAVEPVEAYGGDWPEPGAAGAGPVATERPLSELIAGATSEISTLVKKELELAKVEMKDQVSQAGKTAGMIATTAMGALLAVLMLSFAAAWGLAEVVPTGFAFLVVGLLYAVIAGLVFAQARRRMSSIAPIPEQTVETLKEDVQWAKNLKQSS